MPEQKTSFPMLPINHWWALRKKFKQSIPGVVTEGYLATVLEMKAISARANVLPFLKTLGIIDDDGKTGERARQWRDDEHYAEVCEKILKEVYPQELLDAVPTVSQRAQAEGWFSRKTGAGESAARRMAVLYCLLIEADPSKQPDEKAERTRGQKKTKKLRATAATPAPGPATAPRAHHFEAATNNEHHTSLQAPGININLEIHISADSTTDQIDAIFASMAKHIYQRE